MTKCDICDNGIDYKRKREMTHQTTKLHRMNLEKPWFCRICRNGIEYKRKDIKEHENDIIHRAIVNGDVKPIHAQAVKYLDDRGFDRYWLKCGEFVLTGAKLTKKQMRKYREIADKTYRPKPIKDNSKYYCNKCKLYKIMPEEDYYMCTGCGEKEYYII